MYLAGQGVERDDEAAARWLLAAARQNYAPAQNSVGLLYFKGHGVKQSADDAYFWIHLAMLNGLVGAENNLAFVRTFLDDKKLANIEERAATWWRTQN